MTNLKWANETLAERYRKLLDVDNVRFSCLADKVFLIVGTKRNTKDDLGFWIDESGNEKNWDYLVEKVVASGRTEKELDNSVNKYLYMCDITMEQYLEDLYEII